MPHRHDRRPVAALRAITAAVALLACSHEAAALSSGPARGTPLIGRALQISIPVTWERGEPPPCVRAEFLQGESPGGPLRWRLDQLSGANGLLRLTSSLPVQEPMVTVQLALGCGQQYAREYVLLAEPPNEARDAQAAAEPGADLPVALAPLSLSAATRLGSATPAESAAQPAAATASPTARAAPAAVAPAQRPPRPQRAHTAVARSAHAPQRRESATQVASAKAAAPIDKPSGPRLKLEPIDIAVDDAPVLRLTSTLAPSAPPSQGGALRAEARGLWQALNTSPEQQAAQAQAALALQTELKSMRELVLHYGVESRAATQRLDKVSGERDLMLNVLVGLVVVLGGGFGYLLWLRSRETAVLRGWWEEEHGGPALAKPAKAAKVAASVAAPLATAAVSAPTAAPAEQHAAANSTAFDDLVDLPDFLELDQGRVLSADELLGLKEKADFFLAVGQPDKAVQLLESQLQEHTSSPFVWLDLLDLCRRLERRDDYERLRVAFQKLFSARMPAFDAAMPESNGIEDHPRALSRITQLWGTPRVLSVIEDSLFEEAKPGSITFDLEASRDLLLLYGIANEALAAGATRENFGGAFASTLRAPLVTVTASETEPVPLAALDNLNWPASLLPSSAAPEPKPQTAIAQHAIAPAPAAPVLATEAAAAPDIDLGDLPPDAMLPDDLDFSLSLAPPPERAR